eukprot:m.40826 g.40826  ORF g.40826 m.40826 type:complete len:294 (+) comp10403_c0_seq1:214-1095(+)
MSLLCAPLAAALHGCRRFSKMIPPAIPLATFSSTNDPSSSVFKKSLQVHQINQAHTCNRMLWSWRQDNAGVDVVSLDTFSLKNNLFVKMCDGEICFILRLRRNTPIPKILRNMLANNSILKVGTDMAKSVSDLESTFTVHVNAHLDLNDLGVAVGLNKSSDQLGLQVLTQHLLNFAIPKTSMSTWISNVGVPRDQLAAAATDAWAAWAVFFALYRDHGQRRALGSFLSTYDLLPHNACFDTTPPSLPALPHHAHDQFDLDVNLIAGGLPVVAPIPPRAPSTSKKAGKASVNAL